LKKPFILRLIADCFGRLAMLLLTMVLARFLSVEDFGRFAFAVSCANIIFLIAEAGLHLIFLREMGRAVTDKERENIWDQFFILKTFLTVVVGVLGSIISSIIWPWENPAIMVAIIGWMVGDTFTDFFHQACNATNKMSTSVWIMILHRGFCVFSVIGFFAVWHNLFAVSIGFFFGSVFGAILGFLILKTHLVFVSWPKIKSGISFSWLKVSLPLAIANFFGSTSMRIGILMLPYFCMPEELGFYGAAQKLYEAGYLVPGAFMSIIVPKLSKTLSMYPNTMHAEIRKVGKCVIGMALFWVLSFCLLGDIIIQTIFGSNYGPTVRIFRIMVFANALVFVNYYLTHLLVIYNKLIHYAINESLCLVACFGMTFFLTSRFGMRGAALSLIGTEIMLFILTSLTLFTFHRNNK
jgi:O-antigen/teichoic acid export membrane protein